MRKSFLVSYGNKWLSSKVSTAPSIDIFQQLICGIEIKTGGGFVCQVGGRMSRAVSWQVITNQHPYHLNTLLIPTSLVMVMPRICGDMIKADHRWHDDDMVIELGRCGT